MNVEGESACLVEIGKAVNDQEGMLPVQNSHEVGKLQEWRAWWSVTGGMAQRVGSLV